MTHELRRKRLMDQVGNGIAIIPNAPQRQRNSDVFYPYRPDSDFYFLTHFPEPDSVAVFAPGSDHGDYILFCRERNPEMERWEGYRAGLEGAVETYHADAAYPISELDDKIPELLGNREKIHCSIGRYPEFDENVVKWLNQARRKIRSGIGSPNEIVDISRTIHEYRLFKQPDEIELLKVAANVSANAHKGAMQICQPGVMEYEIQAAIEYQFQKHNCRTAYPSIVASGPNACVLHYIENACKLNEDDLLLIDAGAEYDCYAADITRTFPVNGKFSSHQRAVYEIVLEAQRKSIEIAIPGNRYSDVDETATSVIIDGLIDLGILKCSAMEALEKKAYRPYYMHKIGHWLGLDVHDVGEYRDSEGSRKLEAGMYMTVEPGIYLVPSDDLDENWHNIGIRIEDDVLLTDDGNFVMTAGAPKSISEIEQLMSD